MPNAHGTMMRRPVGIPFILETSSADRKPVAAVGIADFKNGPGNGFSFSGQQLEFAINGLDHGQQCYRPELDRHFHRKSASDFAVI